MAVVQGVRQRGAHAINAILSCGSRALLGLPIAFFSGAAVAAAPPYEPLPPAVEPAVHIPADSQRNIAFLPDGRTLVTQGFFGPIKLWDVTTGKLKQSVGKDLDADSFAVCPDGKRLALLSSSADVALFDLATGTSQPLPGTKGAKAVAFDRSGNIVLVANETGQIQLFDVKTAKATKTLAGKGTVQAMDMSPDGASLAVLADIENPSPGYPVMTVWDLKTAKAVGSVEGQPEGTGSVGRGPGARFSPDGKTILFRRSAGTFAIWDMKAAKVTKEFDAPDRLGDAAISPAADKAAAEIVEYEQSAGLTIWDAAAGGKVLCVLKADRLAGAPVFSPYGKFAAAPASKEVDVWAIPAPATAKPAGELSAAKRMVGIWEAHYDFDKDKMIADLKKANVPDADIPSKAFNMWVNGWSTYFIYNIHADGSLDLHANGRDTKGKWAVTFDSGRTVGVAITMDGETEPENFTFVSQGTGWLLCDFPPLGATIAKPRLFFHYVDSAIPPKYEGTLLARLAALRDAVKLLQGVDSDAAATAAAPKLAALQKKIENLNEAGQALFHSASTSAIDQAHYPEESALEAQLSAAAIAIQLNPARAKALGEIISHLPVSEVAKKTPTPATAREMLADFHNGVEAAKTKYQYKPLGITGEFRSFEPTTEFGEPAILLTMVAPGETAAKPAKILCKMSNTMEASVKQLKPGTKVQVVAMLAPGDCTADVVNVFECTYLAPVKAGK
ncbi:MAG TPA: hypothetical protein VFE47_29600 [Tepidisphaeraceae bacterium]|nr:hypothetical protein [Tepidisphaeraceae bacterium]